MQTLIALALALLMCSSVAVGQENGNLKDRRHVQDTVGEEFLSQQTELLISTGRVEEAIALLEQNISEMTPFLFYRLAKMYEYNDNPVKAERAFRRAIDESKSENERKSSHQGLATFLWRQSRFRDGLEQFEKSRYSSRFDERDLEIYAQLGVAYKSVGDFRKSFLALCAALVHEPTDERIWGILDEGPLREVSDTFVPSGTDSLIPPEWKQFKPILSAGSPAAWQPHEVEPNVRAYKAYGNLLSEKGFSSSARRFKSHSHELPIWAALRAVRTNQTRLAVEYYAVVDSLSSIDQLEKDLQATIYQDLVHAYGKNGWVLQGLAAARKLFRLCRPPESSEEPCHLGAVAPPLYGSNFVPSSEDDADWDRMLEVNVKYFAKLIERAFITVSWNIETGTLRDVTNQEFMGHELTPDTSGEKARARHYGIVSPEEDRVTFLTAYLSTDSEVVSTRLKTAMVNDNWEFVIKAMLIEMQRMMMFGILIGSEFVQSGNFMGVSIEDVRRAYDTGRVARASTRTAFQFLEGARQLTRDVSEWYAEKAGSDGSEMDGAGDMSHIPKN